ncbi:pyridoxal phosphate-dependent aminotransferase [Caenimonas aquaedulcis]|uniref:Aminotransferase n=1 Tax=Caenimonas aquaedulcis TaxID=2793270 RepID=A0A931H2S8_9BURK|nr:pyridoxal phosphate-dependent aminotransferase [Caenimonas aquaedulcis]MBG9387517.1 pyridoxal phosphate-dependent aminotransferase [Caenimonas aquaedulcis]
MRIASLIERIEPFYVMEVAKAASRLAREVAHTDRPMIFLNIGEPDFTAPPLVQEAAARAIRDGATQYTQATGLEPLRERISQWYRDRFKVDVSPKRIVVTAGASAALQLACLALIERGERILMPDPSYPCNCHFVTVAQGEPVRIPATAAERYQLTAAKIEELWTGNTRGVLLASPSNPTGTSIHPDELRRIHDVVSRRGGVTMIDEIYLGLSYEDTFGHSALALDDQVISINSFSKYFNMTGWRLGWVVAPEPVALAIEKLAQNLFICPSAIAQHAALACFEPGSLAEYERRRSEFKARRDFFIPELQAMGLDVPVIPDGAFYAWADCSRACEKLGIKDSWDFTFEVMKRAHVAVTPGRDFGVAETGHFIRFSTANSMAQLRESAARLRAMLA